MKAKEHVPDELEKKMDAVHAVLKEYEERLGEVMSDCEQNILFSDTFISLAEIFCDKKDTESHGIKRRLLGELEDVLDDLRMVFGMEEE